MSRATALSADLEVRTTGFDSSTASGFPTSYDERSSYTEDFLEVVSYLLDIRSALKKRMAPKVMAACLLKLQSEVRGLP